MQSNSTISLSIIVTVVGGKNAVRRCLNAVTPQVNFDDAEIIVPYDTCCVDVGELSDEFPKVNFHCINNLGLARKVSSYQHRLYDRRRAVGLGLARGRIVAMTEDYAVPAKDWCRQISAVHEQPYAVIGGAINNAVDRPLNWALYYCDFGRYGSPLAASAADYISDVNVAYKREALHAVRNVWNGSYHETTVHWALRSRGEVLFIDPRMVVFEERPRIPFLKALPEKFEWGRVFAETRVNACTFPQRLTYIVGSSVLPALLLFRVLRNLLRQRRSARQIAQTLPLAAGLLVAWAFGEFAGYVHGPIEDDCYLTDTVPGI